ncbi:MAG: glycosyltransferase family 4 protein [Clostridiales bacterium]|nr:glycosyltransferase family 4 protein [Clostridiales bacterium]MCF8023148.1 glycosyltransferase family 4 protein [Clostridiales bacterium]
MQKKKVLLITQYYPPDITAAAFRMQDMVNALHKCNYEVEIITTIPHKVTIGQEINDEDFVHRIKVPEGKKGFVARVSNYVSFAVIAILKGIMIRGRFDLVIVSSPPLFLSFTGYILSKIKKAKYIADIRDVWPDSAIAAGMLKQGSILHKIFLRIEKSFYRQADRILCVSKPMREYIMSKSSDKVTVVYNGISNDILGAEVAEVNHDDSKLNIVYIGNVGKVQGLDNVLNVLSRLQNEDIYNVNFKVVGAGVELTRLKERVTSEGIKKVEFTGPVPRDKVGEHAASADVLFLALDDHPSLEKTIPSKLFDYLLYNRPILAGIKGEGKEIIEKLDCGVVFAPGNEDSLVDSIKYLIQRWEEFIWNAKSNRQFVIDNFNRENGFISFFNYLNNDIYSLNS